MSLRRALLGALLLASACDGGAARPPNDPQGQALDRLRAFEQHERLKTDFAALPSWDEVRGADPYAIEPLGDGAVGILRGSSAVVLFDADGRAIARASAPRSPTGLAVRGEEIFVASEYAPRIARYRATGDRLEALEAIDLGDALGVRDVAVGPEGVIYAVEELSDRLLVRGIDSALSHEERVCAGPVAVERAASHLVINCLIDRTLVIRSVDEQGLPLADAVRITHDGPIWSFAARVGSTERAQPERVSQGELLLAIGGVEDRPLDRTVGFFGYIDSFVSLYRVSEGRASRVAAVNVAERGVVTPKALVWLENKNLFVTGYGGEHAVELDDSGRVVATSKLPPGTNDAVSLKDGMLLANPMLDAWVTLPHSVSTRSGKPTRGGEAVLTRVSQGPEPSADRDEIRLGEMLFFTNLMAPDNPSDGAHSRFSCETCHFEGYVDGRTHHTGRGDIRATTKPLYGLFNNKPHFTRALDRDLTVVAHAEFRVAGQGNGHDPWFELAVEPRPWLEPLAGGRERIDPESLRKALMRFLMAFTHRPNPRVIGRDHFDDRESAGARAFRERCASCHAPRLSADDPASAVP
ncbi:MAG TPA: hypothetical protein VFB62_07175, partial [Polyangiaceae bacterium]|nr:hypothetical protein [Polyangiaceae bacterium]